MPKEALEEMSIIGTKDSPEETLICPRCGSPYIKKHDNGYICESCGTTFAKKQYVAELGREDKDKLDETAKSTKKVSVLAVVILVAVLCSCALLAASLIRNADMRSGEITASSQEKPATQSEKQDLQEEEETDMQEEAPSKDEQAEDTDNGNTADSESNVQNVATLFKTIGSLGTLIGFGVGLYGIFTFMTGIRAGYDEEKDHGVHLIAMSVPISILGVFITALANNLMK